MTHSKAKGTNETPKKARYVIWRRPSEEAEWTPIEVTLSQFPEVEVVRMNDDDSAVVRMDSATAGEVEAALPDCVIESDLPFRLAR